MEAARRGHALLPWLLAPACGLAMELLAARYVWSEPVRTLMRGTEASTMVVLLAIRRVWLFDRVGLETVGLGALAPGAWALALALPPGWRWLPGLVLGGAVPVYATWRFMPDRGQSGGWWPWRHGLSRALVPLALLLGGTSTLPGCRRAETPSTVAHEIRGEIVGIMPGRRALLVHHEEIPGYMPGMTMEFTVPATDVTAFKEGQRIAARMIEGAPGEFRLESVRVVDAAKERELQESAAALRQDTLVRGRKAYREMGEEAPRFTLYNQDNDVVSFDRFRGRRVVLNFIFTRCPVPTMCPASTAKMMRLQAAAKAQGVRNLELISITLDPTYDTPAVLKRYARERGIDTVNFTFLTGPEGAVRDLLTSFGVLVTPSETLFKHSLATVLIDERGRIVHRADGSNWDPQEFLRQL